MSTNGIEVAQNESVAISGLYESTDRPGDVQQAPSRAPEVSEGTSKSTKPSADAVSDKAEELSEDQLETLANILNESAKFHNISLLFRVDKDINRIIVTIKNDETEEVIRQVPPENLVQLSKSIGEMVGLLINATA